MKRYITTNQGGAVARQPAQYRPEQTDFSPPQVPNTELVGQPNHMKHLSLKLRSLTNQLIDVLIEIEREVA